MNREIEFRAWDGSEMIYLKNSGLQYFDFEGSYSLGFTVDAYEDFWAHERYESASETASKFPIMQYTGLKDKNGVKIFEGDVICWNFEMQNRIHIGVVTFDEKDLNYRVINNSVNAPALNKSMIKLIEVIGNIHSNPELLEGSNY